MENNQVHDRSAQVEREYARLMQLFKDIDQAKKDLIEGLIVEAAYIRVENAAIRESLNKTGMIRYSPANPAIQKPVESARQYRQNVNTYAVVIKTLNSILQKNALEDDDPFDEWIEGINKERALETDLDHDED